MKRAKTQEEIKPLLSLCKEGCLFEVEKWISAGRPVNVPPPVKGHRRKNPLEIAIEKGFHTLAKVLLEAGAAVEERTYVALEQAVSKKRLDMVKLLVEHGADIRSVSMRRVFDTWNADIMAFFIDNGADVATGHPLAFALMGKVWTALAIYRKYKDRFPAFKEQLNIAVRHHCTEGDAKWVSLLLREGGDPFERGPNYPEENPDPPDEYWSGVEVAAFYGNVDVLRLKAIRTDPRLPTEKTVLKNACSSGVPELLKLLLDAGADPIDMENGGSSLIQHILQGMDMGLGFDETRHGLWEDLFAGRKKGKIGMIHMLAKRGARWAPEGKGEIREARRALLRVSPEVTLDFIRIMAKYGACGREDAEELLRTKTIRELVGESVRKIGKMLERLPDTVKS